VGSFGQPRTSGAPDDRPQLEPEQLNDLPTAYVAALAAVLGLLIGSFLNVVVHRVPRGESVVSPPSACPRCGHPIRNRHNVPVLGWLLLRGRCFDCGEPISVRYPLVELGTGLLFAAVAVRIGAIDTTASFGWFGYSATPPQPPSGWGTGFTGHELRLLPAYLAFAAIGVALALIDLDVRRLPDVIVLPAYPVLAALLLIDHDGPALLRAVIGGAALFAFFLVIWLVVPGGMGFGDVKLSGIVGAMTAYLTWGTLLVGAFGGFLLGAVAGVLLIAGRRAGRRSAVPFGPFMILGALVAILGAGHLGDAYLSALR
jgi:leader peptidase (prepilin peptidase)/N-methyltransferase